MKLEVIIVDHVYCNSCGHEMLVEMGGASYKYSCSCGDRKDLPNQEEGRQKHHELLTEPEANDFEQVQMTLQLEAFRLREITHVELLHSDLSPEEQAEKSPFGSTLWTPVIMPKSDEVDQTKYAGNLLEL